MARTAAIGRERLQQRLQICWQRGLDHQRHRTLPRDFDAGGVQKQVPQTHLTHQPIEVGVTIFVVTGNGMAQMRCMNADLVCSAGS
jgi:hypothetical protein